MKKYININFEKRTRRLIIRPYRKSDHKVWKEAFLTIMNSTNDYDNRIKKSRDNLSKTYFNKIIKNQQKYRSEDSMYDFGVFEKKSRKLIGIVNVFIKQRSVWQNAAIGYLLFSDFQGKGYGQEMVKALLEISFKSLKLHRIEAEIRSDNIDSIKLAKKIGMKREGLKKKYIYNGKKWEDLIIFSIISEDYGIKWRNKIPKLLPRI